MDWAASSASFDGGRDLLDCSDGTGEERAREGTCDLIDGLEILESLVTVAAELLEEILPACFPVPASSPIACAIARLTWKDVDDRSVTDSALDSDLSVDSGEGGCGALVPSVSCDWADGRKTGYVLIDAVSPVCDLELLLDVLARELASIDSLDFFGDTAGGAGRTVEVEASSGMSGIVSTGGTDTLGGLEGVDGGDLDSEVALEGGGSYTENVRCAESGGEGGISFGSSGPRGVPTMHEVCIRPTCLLEMRENKSHRLLARTR